MAENSMHEFKIWTKELTLQSKKRNLKLKGQSVNIAKERNHTQGKRNNVANLKGV